MRLASEQAPGSESAAEGNIYAVALLINNA
jgi:hypothetical protein